MRPAPVATPLVGEGLTSIKIDSRARFALRIQHGDVDSSLTEDVNGFSWGNRPPLGRAVENGTCVALKPPLTG